MPQPVQARAARYPLTVCPTCRRDIRVSPNSEQIYPHDNPDTSSRCTGSGQQVDLYGTRPTPNSQEN